MSVSRRLKKESLGLTDELQAKIVLKKSVKLPSTEIINRALRFAAAKEDEFIEFVTDEKKTDSSARERVVAFLSAPLTGAGPEDYEEYDFEDQE
ncbi:MAG: hypothetical protein ACE5OZ_02645 [Candidatus Heimdallarchaeota archaeon]